MRRLLPFLLAAAPLGCAASSLQKTGAVYAEIEMPPPDISAVPVLPGPGFPRRVRLLFREPDGQMPDYGVGYESYHQGKALWESQSWKASAESFLRAAREFVPHRALSGRNTTSVHKNHVSCLKNAIRALKYAGDRRRQAEVEALLADSLRASGQPSNPRIEADAAKPSEGEGRETE
ncbi:MAG: hypothetical protein ACYTFI_07100 [Planctomycetota bacterium]|jgi:hypothetical protein